MLEIDALAHEALVDLLPLVNQSLGSTNAQIDAINAVKQIAIAGGQLTTQNRDGTAGGGERGGEDSSDTLGSQLDAGSRELELCSALRRVVEKLRRTAAQQLAN